MERIKEQCVIALGIYGDVQAFDIWWCASIFFLYFVIAKVKSAATLIVLQEVACVITYNNDLREKKNVTQCVTSAVLDSDECNPISR